MLQQGKMKTWTSIHNKKQENESFLAYFMRILNSCVV